jgi:hypothetical protein
MLEVVHSAAIVTDIHSMMIASHVGEVVVVVVVFYAYGV